MPGGVDAGGPVVPVGPGGERDGSGAGAGVPEPGSGAGAGPGALPEVVPGAVPGGAGVLPPDAAADSSSRKTLDDSGLAVHCHTPCGQ